MSCNIKTVRDRSCREELGRSKANQGYSLICQQDHTRTDYDPELVGHSQDHSFKALGLGLGATETEVKVRYCALARIYHPEKHDPTRTGLSHEAAADYFKLINNAQAYLSEVL